MAPNSPDFSPVDYAVYKVLQQSISLRFTGRTISDRVHTHWKKVDQQIIDKSIDHWRDKLKAVV